MESLFHLQSFLLLIMGCNFVRCIETDLKGQGLTIIPVSSISEDTTNLLLQNNPLRTIPDGVFQGLNLSDLNVVNLGNTKLTDGNVTGQSFQGLEVTEKVCLKKKHLIIKYYQLWRKRIPEITCLLANCTKFLRRFLLAC